MARAARRLQRSTFMADDHDIVALQVADHAYLDRLFYEYRERSTRGRRETFREIVDLVTTHAFAEEEVLFPMARRVLGDAGEAITSEIESQHQRVNVLLVEMEGREPGDADFDVRVAELFPLLSRDVRNEEDRLLPALSAKMAPGELRALGMAWLAAKKAAPNRAHPRVPRRPPWNALAGVPLLVIDRVRSFFAHRRNTSQ